MLSGEASRILHRRLFPKSTRKLQFLRAGRLRSSNSLQGFAERAMLQTMREGSGQGISIWVSYLKIRSESKGVTAYNLFDLIRVGKFKFGSIGAWAVLQAIPSPNGRGWREAPGEGYRMKSFYGAGHPLPLGEGFLDQRFPHQATANTIPNTTGKMHLAQKSMRLQSATFSRLTR
jgi:hypothetical protein